MKVAIFGAFPHELRSVLKNCGCRPGALHGISCGQFHSTGIITAETGMGKGGIGPVFRDVIECYRPDLVASIGFGGALYEGAEPCETVLGTRFFLISRDGLESIPQKSVLFKNGGREGSIITVSERMNKEDILRMIPEKTPFPVCDMETFHLAKLSGENGIPFVSLRSITDCGHEDIPEKLFDVCGGNGKYAASRAVGVFLKNPRLLSEGLKLSLRSRAASKRLWQAIKQLIEGRSE